MFCIYPGDFSLANRNDYRLVLPRLLLHHRAKYLASTSSRFDLHYLITQSCTLLKLDFVPALFLLGHLNSLSLSCVFSNS